MTKEQKIAILKERLHILQAKDSENTGVCRKINREIRDLQEK